jgi:Uma2 family endonuclease
MALLALDKHKLKALIRERRAIGADRFDEVWNGIYVMAPSANNEHFDFASELQFIIRSALPIHTKVRLHQGPNVTDRHEKWTKNYRSPDLAVFLEGTSARDMGRYWYGGPDFAVEIISPNDRSRKKFAFYAKVGVRELLLVDRKPWALELYRLHEGVLKLIGKSSPEHSETLTSEVLPLSLRCLPGEPRPKIELTQTTDARQWLI